MLSLRLSTVSGNSAIAGSAQGGGVFAGALVPGPLPTVRIVASRFARNVPDGIATVDLKTWELKPLVREKGVTLLFTGRRTRTAITPVSQQVLPRRPLLAVIARRLLHRQRVVEQVVRLDARVD